MNKNREFEEYNPVEASESPYVDGPVYFDTCHLKQNCVFINAGLGYIEETPLIGMTTNINGTPDSNFVDLGFHHPNWNYSNVEQNEPNIIPTISGDPNRLKKFLLPHLKKLCPFVANFSLCFLWPIKSVQPVQSAVKKLEDQIDQMVYKLYGLTPDEIAIVQKTS